MKFKWDDAKRVANLARHGLNFADVVELFDGRPVITTRSPFDGEERFLTVGRINERFVTVVWTWRGESLRIISARGTRDNEKAAYYARYTH